MSVIDTEPKYWDKLYQKSGKPKSQKLVKLLSRFIRIPKSKFESRIHELVSDKNMEKMLEAGCGTGRFVFSSSHSINLAVGVDFSKEAIQTAMQRRNVALTKDNILFCLAEIHNLPFADNSFDLVLSLGVIEHFQNPIPLVSEIKRVLKPGGILFLEVPNRKGFGRSDRWIEQSREIFGYHDFYTYEELSTVASKAGFKINKAYSTDFAAGVRWWYKGYIAVTYFSNDGIFRYINMIIGLMLFLICYPLNNVMKHRGFYSIVEAVK